MKIGILALQGAFVEHEKMLSRLGAESFEIRRREDIDKSFDGLIIPGGESTVIGKLLRELGLFAPLGRMIAEGFPVFGTCAGLILLAEKIQNDSRVYFGAMNICAVRNAFGRQLGSFSAVSRFGEADGVPMTFIRAPYISEVFGKAEPLAEVGGKTVAAKQDNMLATAFHPELTDDVRVHEYFLGMVRKGK